MKNESVPLVSIIVPIFNVEKYLDECLNSVINQTLKEIEIILVNDGSTDSSPEIIKKYAGKDDRIIVIDKENGGYGQSMNLGLKKAKGKYIGVVESDDWIEHDMFKTLFSLAEHNNLEIARSEFYYLDSDTLKDTKSNTDYVPHNCVVSPRDKQSIFMQQPSIWANLYLRTFLTDNEIEFLETPGASYQDTSFSFKVYACAERFMMIDDAFYHYRVGANSSSFQNNAKIYCVCDEYREIWRYTKEKGLYDTYSKLIAEMQFSGYRWNYKRLINPYRNEFFQQWHKEFTVLNEEHLIDVSKYGGKDRELIEAVIRGIDPPMFPFVSVVVPIYNMEKYLRRCLDSIINQTLRELEIICVNDGSTDGSLEIINEYAERDERIVVVNKRNGGLSSARNAGIKNAHCEFIGFVDSDDWVEPETFERALTSIGYNDIVCFGTNVTGDSMKDRREADDEYYRVKFDGGQTLTDEMRLKTDVAVWNKFFRMKMIKENNIQFPEGLLYEDYSFYWRYILLCKKAYFIPDKYYNYLRRDDSIMAETFRKNNRSIEHLKIFPEIYEFGRTHDLWTCRKDTLNSMFLNCFWFAYWNAPPEMKIAVLELGTKEVRSMHLNGERVIDALNDKEYTVIDEKIVYNSTRGIFAKIKNYIFGKKN